MSESCLDFAKREMERLNEEIESLQDSIRRHIETRKAWETIMRNSTEALRVDWPSTPKPPSSAEEARIVSSVVEMPKEAPITMKPDTSVGSKTESSSGSNSESIPEFLLAASEKELEHGKLWKHLSTGTGKKEQFQGLGLGQA